MFNTSVSDVFDEMLHWNILLIDVDSPPCVSKPQQLQPKCFSPRYNCTCSNIRLVCVSWKCNFAQGRLRRCLFGERERVAFAAPIVVSHRSSADAITPPGMASGMDGIRCKPTECVRRYNCPDHPSNARLCIRVFSKPIRQAHL
jgi:hypothetical protein